MSFWPHLATLLPSEHFVNFLWFLLSLFLECVLLIFNIHFFPRLSSVLGMPLSAAQPSALTLGRDSWRPWSACMRRMRQPCVQHWLKTWRRWGNGPSFRWHEFLQITLELEFCWICWGDVEYIIVLYPYNDMLSYNFPSFFPVTAQTGGHTAGDQPAEGWHQSHPGTYWWLGEARKGKLFVPLFWHITKTCIIIRAQAPFWKIKK